MPDFRQFTSSLIIFAVLFYFPGAYAAPNKARSTKYTHATPGEAGGEGQFIHGAKPGVLLIRIHLLGAVSSQGIHYYPENINLLDAMLYAGGMAVTTKMSDITIRRKGVKKLLHYDLEEMLEEGDPFPILKDGDVVRIPWNWRRDIATISLITGFIASMTAFTLSVIALAK